MRLLILSFYFAPDLCAGSFRTTALVDELVKIPNVEIDVLTTMPNRYSSFDCTAKMEEQQEAVFIKRIPLPAHKSGMFDQIKAFQRYYRDVKKFVAQRDYDLVFATSSRLFTAFLGSSIARKKKLPLYLDIRDIFVDTLSDVLHPFVFAVLKPLLVSIESLTFSKAQHINLVSPGFNDYFIPRFSQATYTAFSNGIDDTFLQCHYDSVCNLIDDERKTILYAGNIGEGQGLHTIIPAMADQLSPQYQIKIIGDGGCKAELARRVSHLDNVSLLPPVDRVTLKKYYADADILFLHLNDYSAFEKVLPSKIFEYAATGKPILAGVAGYAASFLEQELDNVAVFPPNNSLMAHQLIPTLKLEMIERTAFIQKYQRKVIMTRMTDSIMKLFT